MRPSFAREGGPGQEWSQTSEGPTRDFEYGVCEYGVRHIPIAHLVTESEFGTSESRIEAWRVLGSWLLRHAAGLSQAEVAGRLDIPEGSLTRLQRLHVKLNEADLSYRKVATELAECCFR